MSGQVSEQAAWRRVCVTDGRTGRAVCVTHRPSEPFWPEVWGEQAPASWARVTRFHGSRSTEVFRGALRDDGDTFFVKVFSSRGPLDSLRSAFRCGRATRAWRRARQAERFGFTVVRPVCLLTAPGWAWPREEVVVTREVAGAQPLNVWLKRLSRPPAGHRALRIQALAALGREVARWHAAGLTHGDLHLENLLIQLEQAGPRFIWLDIEGNLSWPLGVPLRWRARNLADMNYRPDLLSRTDRLRVWTAYVQEAGLPAPRAERLLRAVLERTRRRWRRRGWIS